MALFNEDQIRQAVRDSYSRVAQDGKPCCGGSQNGPAELSMLKSSCCGGSEDTTNKYCCQDSARMGYSPEELSGVPEGADMGLGCGNPQAFAHLKSGETVLDLGCGGGFDSFLASNQVGPEGQVIGVDMTPEMVSKARENAARAGYSNVEFRLGEIEHLPVADSSVDAILSNCVINLSPDKSAVYLDAFRVLKPGGRLAISDMVSIAELPDELGNDLACYCGCITGTIPVDEVRRILAKSGFEDIRVQPKDESREFISSWVPGKRVEDYVVSATIEAIKPG